jgi:hypothetical protein
MGACEASVLGIEDRRIAPSFLCCLGSRASSLSSMLLSAQDMRSHVLLTATGVYPKQKKARQKKLHRDASDASLVIVPHRSSLLCSLQDR